MREYVIMTCCQSLADLTHLVSCVLHPQVSSYPLLYAARSPLLTICEHVMAEQGHIPDGIRSFKQNTVLLQKGSTKMQSKMCTISLFSKGHLWFTPLDTRHVIYACTKTLEFAL